MVTPFLAIFINVMANYSISHMYFSLADVSFYADVFVRTVNSDELADKFGGGLKISTIHHCGWLCGSNRRHLPPVGVDPPDSTEGKSRLHLVSCR